MDTSMGTEAYHVAKCFDEEGIHRSEYHRSKFTRTFSPSSVVNMGPSTERMESDPHFISDENTAILFLTPRYPYSHLGLKLSNAANIVYLDISVQINEDEPIILKLSEPVRRICPLDIRLDFFQGFEAAEIQFLNELTINVTMEMYTYPRVCLCEKPSMDWSSIDEYFFFCEIFSDVAFVLGDKKIHANKYILAANSQVFEEMFVVAPGEEEINTFEIVDIELKVFGEFFQFLYGRRIHDLIDIVDAMMVVADRFKVFDLKLLCENEMLNHLCLDNVLKYNSIADTFGCVRLKQAACELLQNSRGLFSRSDFF